MNCVEQTRFFRDLTEAQLQQALDNQLQGAETEYTLRRQLERYPTVKRANTVPSWGESCVPSEHSAQ